MPASAVAVHQSARWVLRLGGALVAAAIVLIAGRPWVNATYQAAFMAGEAAVLQSARQAGAAVQQDLRSRMVANNREDIQVILADANDLAARQRVMVIGPNNHVYLDSQGLSQDATLSKDLPHCAECHKSPQPPTAAWMTYDPNVIRVATPIQNGTNCSSCHASSNAYLGVVLIDVSLSGVAAQAERSQRGGWALVWVGAALAGGIVFWGLGFLRGLRVGLPRPVLRMRAGPRALGAAFGWWLAGGLAVVGLLAGGGVTVAHIENNNAFCTSCHTQPELTYYARSQSPAVDLASAHPTGQVACIDCHSGAGAFGRPAALLEGANNTVKFVSGHYQSPGVLRGRIDDASCLKCHADVTTSNAPANHFHYYLARWQQAQPATAATCVSCHPAHATGGQAGTHFVLEDRTQAVCAQCHGTAIEAQ